MVPIIHEDKPDKEYFISGSSGHYQAMKQVQGVNVNNINLLNCLAKHPGQRYGKSP